MTGTIIDIGEDETRIKPVAAEHAAKNDMDTLQSSRYDLNVFIGREAESIAHGA
jgi:hypothetical protein